jgi:hypothetical protein
MAVILVKKLFLIKIAMDPHAIGFFYTKIITKACKLKKYIVK